MSRLSIFIAHILIYAIISSELSVQAKEYDVKRFGLITGLKMRYFCAVDVFGKASADSYYQSISSSLLNMSEYETKDELTTELGRITYELNKVYLRKNACEGRGIRGREEWAEYVKEKGITFVP